MAKKRQIDLTSLLSHVVVIPSRGLGVVPTTGVLEGFEDATLFNATTAPDGWVLSDGVSNFAVNEDHVGGGFKSLKWDKQADAADTTATISKTLKNAVDISDLASMAKLVVYFQPPTGAAAAGFQGIVIRLGTDNLNFASFNTLIGTLTEGSWNKIEQNLDIPDTFTGNGLDYENLTYISVLLQFAAAGSADADYIVDTLGIEPFFKT